MENLAKYPPQSYTKKLINKNIIHFVFNELIEEDIDEVLEYVNYRPNNDFVLFYNECNIFSIEEVYRNGEFEAYLVDFKDKDSDHEEVGNVDNVVIYKKINL